MTDQNEPKDLVEVSLDTVATPREVMAVLEDGWLYALWVVGASHIREVDPGWPEPGTRIHHAVGLWPLLIRDTTESRRYDPAGALDLRARGWPLGEAWISIRVVPFGSGSRITIGERAIRGPGQIVRPIEGALIPPRNREALHRLVALAEGRTDRTDRRARADRTDSANGTDVTGRHRNVEDRATAPTTDRA